MNTILAKTSTYYLTICGIILTLLYAYLAWDSHSHTSFLTLILTLLPAAFIVFSCWLYLFYTNQQPIKWQIISWAIIFRLIGIAGAPILEDDYFRYLWDGYMLVEYGSPYGVPPSAFFSADNLSDQFSDILDGVNHPDITTIYGPVCQLVFGLGYVLAPAKVWLLQAFSAMFDIGIILLLSRMTTARNLLLYAWCPLLIKEFAFTAHTDVIAIFFAVAAYSAMLHKHWKSMGTLLAFAVASKVFAILLLPFLLIQSRKSWLPFIGCLALLYLPFADDIFNSNHGLTAMASGWVFNAPLYYLISDLTHLNEWHIKAVLGTTFISFTAYHYYSWLRSKQVNLPNIHWVYGAFLLVLPVLNPWYLAWVLAFATVRPYACLWVASASILLAYAIGLNLNDESITGYQQPTWALIIEYGAIVVAGTIDIIYRSKSHPDTGLHN